MSHIKYIIGFIVLFSNTLVSNNYSNNNFTIHKIYDDEIFYNFVSYENELYISSSNGIYKIDESGDNLILFDASIPGPINTIFERNNNFKIKFIELTNVYPNLYAESITDFAYLDNNLYVIARGKLLIYNNLKYSFNSAGSVRSITENAIGTYGGVYINGNKLSKITYTDGQIKEYDSITFVCYNGLLSYKDNIETKLYNNDNSIRTKGEYGAISDIYALNNSKYLVVSDQGIYKYDYTENIFELIYESQNKVIPLRNKIDSRIKDRGEFNFIDDKKYISLNVSDNSTEIIEDNIKFEIKDILESDLDGNYFYAISNNNLLLSLKRTKEGIKLKGQYPIKTTAHTISDYENLIFLSGDKGLSIFEKTKKKIYDNYIVDEFNKGAIYKGNNKISFGSIHGVYSIDDVTDFEKNIIFKDFKIRKNRPYLYIGLGFLIIILIVMIRALTKKNITEEQLIFNIKRFIRKNLSSVTLKMLEVEFNLDYNEINNLSKNFKPAKYIKKERLELTKKMLGDRKSISEISERTGYSETYLLKNKYKFLK
jgi:AraC-like DNA-binding protein